MTVIAQGTIEPGGVRHNGDYPVLDAPGVWIVETDADGFTMFAFEKGGMVTFSAGRHEWHMGPAVLFNRGEKPIDFVIRMRPRGELLEGMPVPA